MNKLIWFRQDLRVRDNAALSAAVDRANQEGVQVYALYIASPKQWQSHDVAPIQIDLIERRLRALALALRELNIHLQLLHVDEYSSIPLALVDYCKQHNIENVFASQDNEWNELQRDKSAANELAKASISLTLFEQDCILPCELGLNAKGEMYRVFTPYSRHWRRQISCTRTSLLPIPDKVIHSSVSQSGEPQQSDGLSIEANKISSEYWPVGEQGILRHLDNFVEQRIAKYADFRDMPAKDATSGLSPYLALGIISPRQCLQSILACYPEAIAEEDSPATSWLNELIWREFYRHLLKANPSLSKGQNFNPRFDQIDWRNDQAEFDAWCQGMTGYPIVDAAMRQLNQTGWMHNRLRMITASFLIKHLLIDWRWGEAYFKRKLIDGDLAANNGGWQWSAGSGCDAQPYFRIFNPITQAKKFDPQGEFIKAFVPELSHLPLKELHEPQEVERYSSSLNIAYPKAMVEHKFARQRALDKFALLKR